MPVLTLKFKGKFLKQFYLKEDASMTIGRADDNDIVVPNMAASGYHAKIDYVDGAWLLSDLESTNGTMVNDALVSRHRLVHGDRIQVVKHTLVFAYMSGEARPPEDEDGGGRFQFKSMGMLSFVSGGKGEIPLVKDRVRIGREPSAEITVNTVGVGKLAAAITRKSDGYVLSREGGGLSRVKVNGRAVKQPVKLEELDEIEIGPVKLRFYIH